MTDPLRAINQSQLKAWRHCPQMWKYKYEDRLTPRQKVRPLFLGSWVHACLETHYRDGNWEIGNQLYLNEYEKLFDEERVALEGKRGKLPDLVRRIMKSYLWYYKNDEWEVVLTEQIFDVKLKGVRFKGRIDLIIRDAEGRLWVVDHKTAGTIPMVTAFHAMDPQLNLYPWAAEKMWDLDVAGVMYNYVKSKAPTVPQITKRGVLSRRKINTDYPTLLRFLKQNDKDPRDFTSILRPLKRRSDFLRRYKLPRERVVTKRILQEALWTANEIIDHTYTVRNITRDCVRCPYQALCRSDLYGFNSDIIRARDFIVEEDPYGDSDTTEQIQEETEER